MNAPNTFTYVHYALSLPLMVLCGSPYCYSVYEVCLRSKLNLSEYDTTLAVAFLNMGLFGGAVISGPTVRRYGPIVNFALGGVLAGGGYASASAMVSATTITKSPALLCFVYLVIGQGCQFTYMACLVSFIQFDPSHHGRLAGFSHC